MSAEIDLLKTFRLSVGDLTPGSEMDAYYMSFLQSARVQLLADDVSESVLNSELGGVAVVALAEALMNKKDIAADQTIRLLKNTLSAKTKAERCAE